MVAEAGVDDGEVLLAESESLSASVGAAAGYGATTADLPDLTRADPNAAATPEDGGAAVQRQNGATLPVLDEIQPGDVIDGKP
ncbi:hypothetical protein [Sorangium sp. So ce1099]|uniref:hypothetical protein n=1 Tax=Sorangium sp. So ce1099 TaxID=3133331 RepID=UPI003F644BA0